MDKHINVLLQDLILNITPYSKELLYLEKKD